MEKGLDLCVAKNLEFKDSVKNELVVCNPHYLDLTQHIRPLQTPIRKLNPETRIVSNGSMYAGGFSGIKFDKYGIDGIAYIRFLEALKEGGPAEASLLERMSKKLFGEQKADDRFLVEHNSRKYKQQWIVATYEHMQLFSLNRYEKRIEPTKFLMELKTSIANQRNMIVSGELMWELFAPLFDPIIQVYREVVGF